MESQGSYRVVPSVLLVVVQVLAIASASLVPFFVSAAIPTPGPTIAALRFSVAILVFMNCVTVRFMSAKVIAWSGFGLNLLVTALLAVLLRLPSPVDRKSNPNLPRLADVALTSVMLGFSGVTVLLQLVFLILYRSGRLFSLCSGDIDSINIDENDYFEVDGHLLQLQNVTPSKDVHTKCGPGMVPAWLMRIIAFSYMPLSILFIILSIGVVTAASDSKDQHVLEMTRAVSQIYLEQGLVCFSWSIFTLFIAFRFSSRRRLCLFIFIGFIVLIYSMVNYYYVISLRASVQNPGPLIPGFLILNAAVTAVWCAMAAWAVRHRQIFDHSCCLCFQIRSEGLGHCVVA
jgi:hypothetical protein